MLFVKVMLVIGFMSFSCLLGIALGVLEDIIEKREEVKNETK